MTKTIYNKTFPSTTEAVGETITEALTALTKAAWCNEESSFYVRLCLEEALINAVIHGNENEADRAVELDITADRGVCLICVKDEGSGFNPESLRMPDCDQLGGRGVCLIKEYMDDVRFNRKQNRLEMRFRRQRLLGMTARVEAEGSEG